MDEKSKRVVDFIRGCLLDGSLAAGDKLTLGELSEKLAVSTAPVRDGLLRLVERRLVLGGSGSSFYICDYTSQVQLEALNISFFYHRKALAAIAGCSDHRATVAMSIKKTDFESPDISQTIYGLVRSFTKMTLNFLEYMHFSQSFDIAIVPPVSGKRPNMQFVGLGYKRILTHLYDGDEIATARALTALYNVTRTAIRNAHAVKLVCGCDKGKLAGQGDGFIATHI